MFPGKGLRIGRLFGIDLEIHASWLVVFVLVFINLTFSVLPQAAYSTGLGINIVLGLAMTLLFFGSVVAHELAHSLVGRAFGVRIEKITLFIFGGVAQMSGEPKDAPSEFLMAAAGPASSLLLGVGFGVLYILAVFAQAPANVSFALQSLATINVILAVFNLMPGFPLDGGRLFRAVIWLVTKDMEKATRIATRSGQGLAILLMAGGAFIALTPPYDPGGFWYALIGFFLYNAASGSYQQMELGRLLSGVQVSEIMTRGVLTVPADITLEALVADYFLRLRHGRFPVIEDGRMVGTVTLNDVRQVPREGWGALEVGAVTTPLTEEDFVGPEEPAYAALLRLAASRSGQLLVREAGRVTGILTKTDLMEAIRLRSALAGVSGHEG